MTDNLDLKMERIDQDTIRVSWNDTNPNPWVMFVFIAVLIFMLIVFVAIGAPTESGLLGFVGLTVIMTILWFIIKRKPQLRRIFALSHTKPNVVEFGRTTTIHGSSSIPTDEITRFEYGLKSQLIGVRPVESENDPMVIRMWLNDSKAYDFSENNWQTQLNHEIRDTLALALKAVRNIEKQEFHEAEFGKTGDFGMPEY